MSNWTKWLLVAIALVIAIALFLSGGCYTKYSQNTALTPPPAPVDNSVANNNTVVDNNSVEDGNSLDDLIVQHEESLREMAILQAKYDQLSADCNPCKPKPAVVSTRPRPQPSRPVPPKREPAKPRPVRVIPPQPAPEPERFIPPPPPEPVYEAGPTAGCPQTEPN